MTLVLPSPQSDPRAFLRALFDVAVTRALPSHSIAAFLPAPPDTGKGRTLVLGAGKAGGAMAAAVDAHWPANAPMSGLVVTRPLEIAPGYAATIAAEGGSWTVRVRDFPEAPAAL